MKLIRQTIKYCLHIVCNVIQVKVNLELTLLFIWVFQTVPAVSDFAFVNWAAAKVQTDPDRSGGKLNSSPSGLGGASITDL